MTADRELRMADRARLELPELPDRWRLLAELPAGRRAQVWIAEDLELGRQVVLKVFPPCANPKDRARGLVEISLGQRLDHPNLVRLYEVREAGQHLVAAMELMSGGSLAKRLAFAGPQPVERVVEWTGQILEALAYLHDRKLVHRDVKPSNLLLTDGDDLKLADFGLVGRIDRGRYLPETAAGVGTEGYKAPEQENGEDPAPSWDLYALGVTLFQLLTGARPAVEDGLEGRRDDCPLWLEQFVERLRAARPLDRWSSAREALAVFETQRTA
jgi:serine/threonine protein kinase